MTLVQVAVLAALAVVLGRLRAGRQIALLAASTAVLFWLQPLEPIASLSFWLPVGTVTLTALCWVITAAPDSRSWRTNWPAVAIMMGVIIVVGVSPALTARWNPAVVVPSASRMIGAAFCILACAAVLWRWGRRRLGVILAAATLLLVFVIIKSPPLLALAIKWWSGLPLGTAPAADIPFAWLGYSYVAFRLLHTLRDSQSGRLPALSLGEYVNYVIFFPSFVAGPIDRAQRFVSDLRSPLPLTHEDLVHAGTRLVLGLFKKLVLADLLAVIALNDVLVENVRRPGWMWLFLYAYAFRIFLDFSGYTDIAIAMGRLLGVRLPENFAAPYLKPNIALFWNSWHISLTQWFRSYVFNPLARRLRGAPSRMPEWSTVLVTQVVTMGLIGMWHGITWSFLLWGLWHAIGLFIHNRWSGFVGARWPGLALSPSMSRVSGILGTVVTFNYVSLGWLFFGLSTPQLTWRALGMLFGAA